MSKFHQTMSVQKNMHEKMGQKIGYSDTLILLEDIGRIYSSTLVRLLLFSMNSSLTVENKTVTFLHTPALSKYVIAVPACLETGLFPSMTGELFHRSKTSH